MNTKLITKYMENFDTHGNKYDTFTAEYVTDLGFHCGTLHHSAQLNLYTVRAHFDGLAADVVLYSGDSVRKAEFALNRLTFHQGFNYYPVEEELKCFYEYFQPKPCPAII